MMVSTRLWGAGSVQVSREKGLADAVLQQVRRAAAGLRPLLVVTDGWSASPGSIRRAFREQVNATTGRGRACVQGWPDLQSGTVITRTQNKRVVEIARTMAHGVLEQAAHVLELSRGGKELHTACIERVHGTCRERLASLTRTSRHAAARVRSFHTGMSVIGCPSTVCLAHQERSKDTQWGTACTPAMASGRTDHVWSGGALLSSNVAPAPWVEPTRRGRPPKPMGARATPITRSIRSSASRPLLRLRRGVFCSPTVSCGSTPINRQHGLRFV